MSRLHLTKKKVTDKNGVQRTVYVKANKGIGLDRKDMPQVTGENTQDYLKWLSDQGVKHEKGSEDVKTLKATQKHFNKKRVKEMIERAEETKDSKWLKRTVIISKDNHILDGHHRWAALKEMGGDQKMDTIKIDLPIDKLIEITNKYPKVEKRGLKHGIKDKK